MPTTKHPAAPTRGVNPAGDAGRGPERDHAGRQAPTGRPRFRPMALSILRGPRGRGYGDRPGDESDRSVSAGWPRAAGGGRASARPRFDVGRGLGVLLLGVSLAGCEELRPYRTDGLDIAKPIGGPACDPDKDYNVPERCRTQIVEHNNDYVLFFNEFTDQGLQYPSDRNGWDKAGYQIDRTIAGLKQIADGQEEGRPKYDGISVVVFVHGWQHNAGHDDGNVRSFRELLQSAASLERARGSNDRVVGIYVGWRGRSISAEPLSKLSFWSRKATALRVAQGSPRELFNRLRSFKCAQNRTATREPGRTDSPGNCNEPAGQDAPPPKVRMLMIGHSFGGLILYNAVSGSLIESLTHAEDTGDSNTANTRYADMVVLLNPAFEASAYTSLHRVASSVKYPAYQAPILVSVTSKADWATRGAFPLGRLFNAMFEDAANDEEEDATRYTMGHMPAYITHDLSQTDERPKECADWKPLRGGLTPQERDAQAARNARAERDNRRQFLMHQPLPEDWSRVFCLEPEQGGVRLRHRVKVSDPNSIVWNVSTDGTIMKGHNDIANPNVKEFLRQLYQDTLPRPYQDAPLRPPPPLPAAPGASAVPPDAAPVDRAAVRR